MGRVVFRERIISQRPLVSIVLKLIRSLRANSLDSTRLGADFIGFALLIPPTRAVFRTVVARLAKRRVAFAWAIPTGPPRAGGPSRAPANRGYDYEGTAREVHEPSAELGPGDRDA